jgi:hypothetical protein
MLPLQLHAGTLQLLMPCFEGSSCHRQAALVREMMLVSAPLVVCQVSMRGHHCCTMCRADPWRQHLGLAGDHH